MILKTGLPFLIPMKSRVLALPPASSLVSLRCSMKTLYASFSLKALVKRKVSRNIISTKSS